ncbi:formyl-CoA transferase/CoA:oxalate CoA-transferase [Mesobacillus persicus]|uniref:Formyl-CoA transferase/CoA:oxalate CoA-transferase n=1 Tax=Mesobacillus persicus TaxID=930146 RepID=A0A1H8DCL7_9BACI|nr:CoA transferase [Mesobacillus persicus]SEN04328.1 formyl-CoA transferase/CoA:oxalate CoA-transferase [Mesobacillus persicus]
MSKQALSGLKVIDLSWHIAGPYCTKLLADLGADVIKIEQPGIGDPSRREGPFPNDQQDLNASGLYAYLNNNKKGITLNLKSKQGSEFVKKLVKEADIVVENFSPRVMEGLGLSYETLIEINPRLIMTSITNFGQTGAFRDRKGTEIVAQAMGGFMSSVGEPNREPLRAGGNLRLLEYISGSFAGMSTLAAVAQRRKTNQGQHVDVSITECGLLQRSYQTVQNSFPTSPAKHVRRYVMMPSIEKCKDGYIGINLLTGKHWQDFCLMTEMYEWIEDERFTTLGQRLIHKDLFRERFDPWLMAHTREEIIELGQQWRVPVNPVPTFTEMLNFPQYEARKFFVEIEHPVMGKVTQPGAPYTMSETPWKIQRPAPLLGEHNSYVYKEVLGLDGEELEQLQAEGVV